LAGLVASDIIAHKKGLAMDIVWVVLHIVLKTLQVLALCLWGGGLVVLALATGMIEDALQKRRTEGRQIIRRLRGVFQRIELICLIAVWGANLIHLGLEHFLLEKFPGVWTPGMSIAMGVLVLPTIAALHSTFFLSRSIRTHETQLGSYADKNEQTRVRKTLANLHRQARTLTWLKAGAVAAVIIAGIAGMN